MQREEEKQLLKKRNVGDLIFKDPLKPRNIFELPEKIRARIISMPGEHRSAAADFFDVWKARYRELAARHAEEQRQMLARHDAEKAELTAGITALLRRTLKSETSKYKGKPGQ